MHSAVFCGRDGSKPSFSDSSKINFDRDSASLNRGNSIFSALF